MKLGSKWKEVVAKAWSFRLMALAAVLTGIEAILPMFTPVQPSPYFAAMTFAVVVAAMVSRLLVQKNLS